MKFTLLGSFLQCNKFQSYLESLQVGCCCARRQAPVCRGNRAFDAPHVRCPAYTTSGADALRCHRPHSTSHSGVVPPSRRQQGKNSQYWDDCGAWQASTARGLKTTFLCTPGQSLRKVVLRDGQFCLERQKNKKTVHPSRPPAHP